MSESVTGYPLTSALIGLNLLVYLFTALMSGSVAESDLQVLVDTGALYGPLVVLKGEWWRLLSAMFLHGGMTHLLMNMVSLYIVGRGVESYFSKPAYLALYLFSGLIGGIASLTVHPQSVGIGASGAIFGLFGALAGFFLAHRKQIAAYSREFMKDFAAIIGINLLLGLSIPSIDMSAHIGGLLAGFAGGYMLAVRPQWLWGCAVAMSVVVAGGISWLSGYDALFYR
jgi:rhomboid protease GluP